MHMENHKSLHGGYSLGLCFIREIDFRLTFMEVIGYLTIFAYRNTSLKLFNLALPEMRKEKIDTND